MNCFCPLFGSSRILPVQSQSSSSPLYQHQDSSTTHIIDRRDPSAQLGVGVTSSSSSNSWWSSAVWWSLKLDLLHLLCSHELKQVLFLEDDDEEEDTINSSNNTNPNEGLYTRSASQEESWIVRGVPTRPLYKEFAHRLFQWNQRLVVLSSSSSSCTPCNIQELRLLIPAESLGFQENQHDPMLPSLPPRSPGDIPMWFLREQRRDRDRVIYRVLGIRTTIGSVRPMVHCLTVLPSKRRLLKAATVFLPRKNKNTKTSRKKKKKKKNRPPRGEQNCLTVAAKARAKHAGRTTSHVDGDTTVTFFGTVSGPIGQQNREAILLVRTILKQCVWMNCHVLGGLSSSSSSSSSNSKTPTTYHDQLPNDDDDDEDREDSSSFVVELRQEQGYGARWLIEREEKQKQELVVSSSTIVSPSSSVGNRKNVHIFPRTATMAVIDDTNTNAKHSMNYTRSGSLSSSVLVTFRGFLEPHMKNGHEQKWRH